MTARNIKNLTIHEIRQMIVAGFSDEDIALEDGQAGEDAAEEAQDDAEYERRYGDDYNDDTREHGSTAEYNDRLSMGRNDAGEWMGFM